MYITNAGKEDRRDMGHHIRTKGHPYSHLSIDHNEVQKQLKSDLSEYVKEYYEDTSVVSVESESRIELPHVDKVRSIDVAVHTNDIHGDFYKGIAFEIKVVNSSEAQQKGTKQLADYLVAGYYPILVSPMRLYLLETRYTPSLEWTTEAIRASYLEIIDDDPYRFYLKEDWIPIRNGLDNFFPR